MLIKLDKKSILSVLTSVLLFSAILSTQSATLETGKAPDHAVMQDAVHATDFGDIEIVSVAYDPNVESYPNKSESPYGPDVNPTYSLVEQALVSQNPENPDNPLSNIIQQGDTVVLKPNLVGKSGFAREGCTRTPILRPLVDFAVQASASKVIIAEGSAFPYPDSAVFGPDYSNITGLVEALQSIYPDVVITYKDLNLDDFTWVDLGENSTFYGVYAPQQLYSVNNMRMDEDSYYYAQDCNGINPKGYRPGLYAIANTVFQADVFINVPKMKVHWITGVTLSLKNLVGITVSSTGNTTHEESIKDIPHWNNSGPKPVYDEVLTRQDSFANDVVWRVIADLNKIVLYADAIGVLQPVKQRRYLSVVDAIIGMEGPTVYNPPGVPRPTGAIIAGQNPVAVDAVCSRVMGFNYTVLNSVVNMEQISDHPIGMADPTAICVMGTSLNGQTFGEPYMPHKDYEDSQIAPYQIRLQFFDPPEAELIETEPETPREGVETKVIVYTQNIDLVAAGWLRYSLDGAEPMIMKMVPSGETMIGNLGLLEGGTRVSYDVCLQDYFFNTGWSDKISIFVPPRMYLFVRGLDNSIYCRTCNGSWGDWTRLPGLTCDRPAAAILGRMTTTNLTTWSNGFEEGDFSEWSQEIEDTGCSAAVVTTDPHGGSYHASFSTTSDSSAYIRRTLDDSPSSVYISAYVKPMHRDAGAWTWVLGLGRNDLGVAAVIWDTHGYWSLSYRDGGLWRSADSSVIATNDVWYLIELYHKSGSGDGEDKLWVNGNLEVSIAGLDNDDRGDPAYAMMGKVYGTDDGDPVVYIDSVIVRYETATFTATAMTALHVVVRGANGKSLWHSHTNLTDNSFSGWTRIPGQTPSAPTLSIDRYKLYLVVRDMNDRICYNVWNRGWSGWRRISSGSTTDSPAAAVLDGFLHIVVRGRNSHTLWHGSVNLTDSSFSGWTRVPGQTPSAPTLTSDGSNLYLVVRGMNDRVYYKVRRASWSDWMPIPSGSTTDSPAAAVVDGVLRIVVRGRNANTLWYCEVDLADGNFSGWTRLSGQTPSAPTLTNQ